MPSASRALPLDGASRSTPTALSGAQRAVYADALSQAVTAEWIGMLNYAALAGIVPSVDLAESYVAHANSERRHALLLRQAAQREGLSLIEDTKSRYWGQVRDEFDAYVRQRDWIACLLVQEVLLESVAIALYTALGEVTRGGLGTLFLQLASEEGEHAGSGESVLRGERDRGAASFDAKARQVHDRVMPILARMVSKRDPDGHCGLCADGCVKESLGEVGVDVATLRGRVLEQVLLRLDAIGVAGEDSLGWIVNLPR